MSSTDDPQARLEAFFTGQLVPAAQSLRARGVEFFPLGPDAGAPTYWHRRDDAGDYLDSVDPAATAVRLRELWAEHPELVALVDPLLEMAAALARPADEQSPDVSPFIYAMY
ncbi:hypothetical protein [Longimicrobium sp.]|uniref:hypothetical protein n=1 Tax=Longimicrobium sp. TaxID=2029185 RepID=UPI003B3A0518